MSVRTNFLLLPLGLALLGGKAAAEDWQSLLANSPFGQPAAGPAAGVVTGGLEFRGVVQEEGVVLVNLYDPTTKTAQWIEVSGQAPGLEVQAYDAVSDKVQITQAGRSLTLPLKQARVALVAAPPPPSPTENPAPPIEGPEVPGGDRRAQIRELIRNRMDNGPARNPAGDPAQAVRNLPPEAQAMIEEFRRRRAVRSTNQPGGPIPIERNGTSTGPSQIREQP